MTTAPKRWIGTVAAVLFLALPLAACSAASPPVGGVPGTYTFSQHLMLFQGSGVAYGPVGGTATICVTTRTALNVVQTAGFGGGFVSVTFDGVSQYGGLLFGTPWTTAPVGPSCGQLQVSQGPGFIDPSGSNTITVSVTAA